ncbi:MAG: serine hydrolase domain-containing protein [Candidatus Krumholzibacteriia bacterium]
MPQRPYSVLFAPLLVLVALTVPLDATGQATGAAAPAGGGAGGGADPVDAWVLEWMAERDIPGLSLAVVVDGQVEKLEGYGLASLELDVAASPATVYRLASITKSFTGAAVMALVEAGRLSLEDPIEAHLDGLPAHWHGITVRRLLTHTSGLPDLVTQSTFALEAVASTLQAALDSVARLPMQFATGTSWRYNQTNYALAQVLVEALSAQSFPAFVEERLLRPAGMERTVFGGSSAVVDGRGPWYSRLEVAEDGGLRPGETLRRLHVDYPEFMLSAGGLNSTVEDLVRWDRALRDGTVLSPESLEELWQPVRLADGSVFRLDGRVLGYALGWSTIDRPEHRAVWASGGNTVALHRYLDDDVTVIVLTNCQGSGPNEIAEKVAGFYVPALRDDPVFLPREG